jgi:hypothetical protein
VQSTNPDVPMQQITLCNGQIEGVGTPQPCPTNPTSALITASVTGPFQTFNNPFQRVLFYLEPAGPNHRAHLIGQGTIGVFDNTVTNTRTWTYTVNFSAIGWAPGSWRVFAVGVDANGDALMTQWTGVFIQID